MGSNLCADACCDIEWPSNRHRHRIAVSANVDGQLYAWMLTFDNDEHGRPFSDTQIKEMAANISTMDARAALSDLKKRGLLTYSKSSSEQTTTAMMRSQRIARQGLQSTRADRRLDRRRISGL